MGLTRAALAHSTPYQEDEEWTRGRRLRSGMRLGPTWKTKEHEKRRATIGEIKMLVTVLTVAFNSEATIARTIESVLNQTFGASAPQPLPSTLPLSSAASTASATEQNKGRVDDGADGGSGEGECVDDHTDSESDVLEYIIIDGASTDNTVEIARSYQPIFDARPGRKLVVLSEPDQGMYDALNKGARMAQGFLVGQINADDWYEPDAVSNMVELWKRTGYDVAWGSLNMCSWNKDGSPKKPWVKKAHIGRLWTSAGWCHPAMFSTVSTLLSFPYPLESMYDDWDYITACHQAGKKIVTTDKVISNFSFTGGQSTKKSLKEVKKRVGVTYGIYKKYGMSRGYWFYRWAYELAKFVAE